MGSSAHGADTGNANSAARNRIRRTGLLLRAYRRPVAIEWPSGSRSATGVDGGRFHAINAPMTTANDTALIANTACGPATATRTPAIGGPIARAASTVTPLRDAAAGNCSRGTNSGWIACQAGVVIAAAQPIANKSDSSERELRTPATVIAVNTAAAAAAYTCSAISNRLRSTRSASAPAKSARINVGDRLAVWTSATVVALAFSVTRNHCAPTVCIHVPMLEARAAMNRPRNAPIRSGAHIDDAGPTSSDPIVVSPEV